MRKSKRSIRKFLRIILALLSSFSLFILPVNASDDKVVFTNFDVNKIQTGQITEQQAKNMTQTLKLLDLSDSQYLIIRHKENGSIFMTTQPMIVSSNDMPVMLGHSNGTYYMPSANYMFFDATGKYQSNHMAGSVNSSVSSGGKLEVLAMVGFVQESVKEVTEYVTGNTNDTRYYCKTYAAYLNDGYTCSQTATVKDTGTFRFNLTSTLREVSFLHYTDVKLAKGLNSAVRIEGAIDDATNAVNDVNNTLNDSSVDTSQGGDFFNGFQSDSHGLTSIVSAPLQLIKNINNNSCTDVPLPLPYIGKNLMLPCMTSIYTQMFGGFLLLWQTITTGFISYYVTVRLFSTVKNIKDPNNQDIEVADL